MENDIEKYISATMLDIEIPIKIKRTDKSETVIEKRQIRNQFEHKINSPVFKLEIKDGKVNKLTDNDSKSIMFFKFFAKDPNWKDLNNGILMKESKKRFLENTDYCDILIGYPAEAIQLDVSREKIVSYKKEKKDSNYIFYPNDEKTKNDILKELKIQFSEWLDKIKPSTKISNYKINHIHRFFISNNCEMNDLSNKFLKMFIWIEDEKIKFKFSNYSSINPSEYICFTNRYTLNAGQIKSKKDVLNKISKNILKRDFERHFERHFGIDFGRYFERDFERYFERDFERDFGIDFERYFERYFERDFGRYFERDFERDLERDFVKDSLVLMITKYQSNSNMNNNKESKGKTRDENQHIYFLLSCLQYMYLVFTMVIKYDKKIDFEIEL